MEHSSHCRPLSIPLILDKIFQDARLTIKDLAACRSVCRLWNEISTPYFEIRLRQIHIQITNESQVPAMLNRFEGGIQGPTKFSFSDINLASSTVRELLDVIGSKITSLNLRYRQHHSDSAPISCHLFEKLLCEQCANLELLSLEEMPYSIKNEATIENTKQLNITDIFIREEKYSRNFLQNLFSVCPKLKNVKLYSLSKLDSSSIVESLFHSGTLLQLNSLRLDFISGSTFRKYLRPCLQQSTHITELTIYELGCDYIEGQELNDFMESSLKYLDLGFKVNRIDSEIRIPALINLVALRIHCSGPGNFRQLSFASQFPCLEKLHITMQRYDTADLFVRVQPPCPNVKELMVQSVPCNFSTISNMIKMFPNVENLTLCIQLETLPEIWSSWTNLKKLRLCVSKNDDEWLGLDSLLTGIPQNVCQQLKSTNAFDTVPLEKVEVHPSITNLKQLKHLSFQFGSAWNSFSVIPRDKKFSDVSAFLAISSMKTLEYIDLGRGGMFTPRGVNEICSELGLVHASDHHFYAFYKDFKHDFVHRETVWSNYRMERIL